MWKWLGLVLTLLVIGLCVVLVGQTHITNVRLERVLATQQELERRINWIQWAIETSPLVECDRIKFGRDTKRELPEGTRK